MIITLRDEFSHFKIIIDTSSSISIFPERNTTYPSSNLQLYTINGILPLFTIREKSIKIRGNTYTWHFYTTHIPHIVLGYDFITAFGYIN